MEGNVTKVAINSMVEYASGTDGNLNSPVNTLNTALSFLPFNESGFGCTIRMGGNILWSVASVVGMVTFSGGGTPYAPQGTLAIYLGFNPNVFAGAEYNGLQRMTFSKYTDGDGLGGYVEYYYNREAYMNAFDDSNPAVAIITLDGSVYKDAVTTDNLVVDSLGNIGKAGGGNYVPFASAVQSVRGDISPEVISISKHGEHIII